MKYGKARELVESAIELLSEGMISMENKPSINKSMEKPTKPVAKPLAKPSAQGRATNSPAVKFGKRTTSRRYLTRGNRWALRQIARNKAAVSEAIEQLGEEELGVSSSGKWSMSKWKSDMKRTMKKMDAKDKKISKAGGGVSTGGGLPKYHGPKSPLD